MIHLIAKGFSIEGFKYLKKIKEKIKLCSQESLHPYQTLFQFHQRYGF